MQPPAKESNNRRLTRGDVTAIGIVGVVLAVGLIALSLFFPSIISLSAAADLIAGVGTFALALAAAYTLVTEDEHRVRERLDRLAERAPHLVVQGATFVRPHRPRDAPGARPRVMFGERAIVLLNDGLGPAQGLKWKVTKEQVPIDVPPWDVPIDIMNPDADIYEYDVDQDSIGTALFHPGVKNQFEVVNRDRPRIFPPEEPEPQVVRVVVEAWASDMEGNPIGGAIGGLKHSRAWTLKDHSQDDVGKDKLYHVTRSRWTDMDEKECEDVLSRCAGELERVRKIREQAKTGG